MPALAELAILWRLVLPLLVLTRASSHHDRTDYNDPSAGCTICPESSITVLMPLIIAGGAVLSISLLSTCCHFISRHIAKKRSSTALPGKACSVVLACVSGGHRCACCSSRCSCMLSCVLVCSRVLPHALAIHAPCPHHTPLFPSEAQTPLFSQAMGKSFGPVVSCRSHPSWACRR